MTPLEQATKIAVEEQAKLLANVKQLEQELKSSIDREAIQRGRIAALEEEIGRVKDRSDYNLRCAIEIAMQLHNVGIFVSDALHTAKSAVGKSDGQSLETAYRAVEKALSNEHLQSKDDDEGTPNNKVLGRS